MTICEYSPAELEAIRVFTEALPAEREKLLEEKIYKDLINKYPQALVNSHAMEVLASALIELMPSSMQDSVKAMQFVSYGLARILARPEVQKSAEVAQALQAIHESVSTLSLLEVRAEDIWKAFALPYAREENRRKAKKLRTKEPELKGAISLFDKWKESPWLYRNISEFAHACIVQKYAQTEATAKKWAKLWGSQLPAEHPLRAKLGKLG